MHIFFYLNIIKKTTDSCSYSYFLQEGGICAFISLRIKGLNVLHFGTYVHFLVEIRLSCLSSKFRPQFVLDARRLETGVAFRRKNQPTRSLKLINTLYFIWLFTFAHLFV